VLVLCIIFVVIFQLVQYFLDQTEINRQKTLWFLSGMSFCIIVFCLSKLNSVFMHILMIVPFSYGVMMAYFLEYEAIHA
jgi:hypothetical protein